MTARAVLAIALVLTALPAFAQAPVKPPSTLTVTGEGSVSAAPDLAEIDGGVTAEAKTAREASETAAKAMAEVVRALKAAGIADKDIRTTRISLFPQSAPARSPQPAQITGYRAANHVRVSVRDLARAAMVLDTMLAAGANEIGNIGFLIAEPSPPLDLARAAAIADARRKAEVYAKAAGVTLGSPLSISEEGSAPPLIQMRRMAVGAAAAPTPVEPGELTLRINVSVTYEIKAP
ncbi:MAG: DUF541 domain-containing protein [Xanthobacteraceae bacterium]|nr:MAG: DUF541 domain-containing protein [Xanthobacteraceae bacterium]